MKDALILQFKKRPEVIIGQSTVPVYAEIRRSPANQQRSQRRHPRHQHHHPRHYHGFHNPGSSSHSRSSSLTGQHEQPHREMLVDERVELMNIATPPSHPPPASAAITNQVYSLASHSQSSPAFRNNPRRGGQQNQNHFNSERHITEDQLQSSILHVPETRPLSPLTYGSDSGSNISNLDDIDHVSLSPRRTQGVNVETNGAAAVVSATVTEDGGEDKEDLLVTVPLVSDGDVRHEGGARLVSPTLTDLYRQTRRSSRSASAGSHNAEPHPSQQDNSVSASVGSGQGSEVGGVVGGASPAPAAAEEGNGLAVASEDPLWYRNRDSGHFETDPLPYETAVRSPLPSSTAVSPSAEDEGEMRLTSFPVTSLTGSRHSDSSVTSSSKHSSDSKNSSRHRSPSLASPSTIGVAHGHEHKRKRSLPVSHTQKHSKSSTKNPLYSSSAAMPAMKRSLKKQRRNFNSPNDDGKPLPPLPTADPMYISPLPSLPRPLEGPGGMSSMKKRPVARTESDTVRHTHFATHVPVHQQMLDGQSSPRAAAVSSRTPPLSQVRTPPLSQVKTPPLSQVRTPPLSQVRTPPLSKVSSTSGASVLPSSLQSQVGVGEKRSLSSSSSPAQSREKKKGGLERNDSYHSVGPSAEGRKVNQIIRYDVSVCNGPVMS